MIALAREAAGAGGPPRRDSNARIRAARGLARASRAASTRRSAEQGAGRRPPRSTRPSAYGRRGSRARPGLAGPPPVDRKRSAATSPRRRPARAVVSTVGRGATRPCMVAARRRGSPGREAAGIGAGRAHRRSPTCVRRPPAPGHARARSSQAGGGDGTAAAKPVAFSRGVGRRRARGPGAFNFIANQGTEARRRSEREPRVDDDPHRGGHPPGERARWTRRLPGRPRDAPRPRADRVPHEPAATSRGPPRATPPPHRCLDRRLGARSPARRPRPSSSSRAGATRALIAAPSWPRRRRLTTCRASRGLALIFSRSAPPSPLS